jgi:hypothetical protein
MKMSGKEAEHPQKHGHFSMRPPVIVMQQKLFSPNLMDQLNPNNEWLLLGRVMDWAALDARFGSGFAPGFGRPAVPTRTILGLLIARQMRDLSDRGVIDLFVESPYIQAFCGYTEFQLEPPCDASSLTRWRKRKGKDLESLLAATIQAALESGALKAARESVRNLDRAGEGGDAADRREVALCDAKGAGARGALARHRDQAAGAARSAEAQSQARTAAPRAQA